MLSIEDLNYTRTFHLVLRSNKGKEEEGGKEGLKKGEKEGNDRGWETTFVHRSRENEIETIKEYRKMEGRAPLVFQRFQTTQRTFMSVPPRRNLRRF